jgi:glycerol-3-phosphate acyltransferase PlsY
MMSIFFTDLSHPLQPLLVTFFAAYLFGSVPYGLILARLAGVKDIRKEGSGNIGATNVLRVAGKKVAVATLLLDALKGFIPVMVAKSVHADYGVLAALAAFLGHVFPVWLKFKGGKGVATALGVCFGFSYAIGGLLCATWLILASLFAYSSAAALGAFAFAPLLVLYMTKSIETTLVIFIIAVIIWIRHAANLKRLANGTESKINFSKKDKPAA